MGTLSTAGVKKAPEDSAESKIYNLVESFIDNIPIQNDRYRLAYSLLQTYQGKGDTPDIAVRTSKIKIENISMEKLITDISERLKQL